MTIPNALARDYRFPLFQAVLIAIGAALCLYGWRLAADAEKSGFTGADCQIIKTGIGRFYQNRFGWFGGKRLVQNPVVSCTYAARGKSIYFRERLATDTPLSDGLAEAERYVREHPPGSIVKIVYDPDDPKQEFLARDATLKEYWPFVPGMVLMLTGTLWLLSTPGKKTKAGDPFFSNGDTEFAAEDSGFGFGLLMFSIFAGIPLIVAFAVHWAISILFSLPFLPFIGVAFLFLGYRQSVRFDRATGYFEARQYLYLPIVRKRDRLSAIEYVQLSKGMPPGLVGKPPFFLRPLLFLLSGKNPPKGYVNLAFKADRWVISVMYKGERLPLPNDFDPTEKNAQRLARLIGCRLALPEGVQEAAATPRPEEKRATLPTPPASAVAEKIKKADFRPPFAWFAILWGCTFTAFFGWATYKSAVAFTWKEAPGVMVSFDSTYHGSDYGYDVTAKYTYEVGGRYYTGDRVAASASNSHVGNYRLGDWHRRFGYPKTPVTVYYDPRDPHTAVLVREDIQAAVCLVMGLLSIAIGQYLRHLLKREKFPSPGRSAGIEGTTGFIKGGSVFRTAEHRWYLGAFILIAFSPAIADFFQYQRDMGFAEKAVFAILLAVSLPLLFYKKESVVDKQTGMFTFSSSMIIPYRRYTAPLDGINYIELNTSQQESGDENYNLALVVVTDGGRFELASTAAFATPVVARRLAVLVDRPVKFTGIRAFWHLEDAEESPDTARERLKAD